MATIFYNKAKAGIMTLQKLLLWFSVMAPLAYSAGPNNIMCASLGSKFGMRSVIPFIAGMNTTVLNCHFACWFWV
ncbi:MAG: hypothetical protein HC896_08480 [Bacteroidales bacterium]|nr:hypothetical protein [Bacteroidales bacterium]